MSFITYIKNENVEVTAEQLATPPDSSPTDVSAVAERLDRLYQLGFVFVIFFVAFKVHGIFRTMFNNLKRGE